MSSMIRRARRNRVFMPTAFGAFSGARTALRTYRSAARAARVGMSRTRTMTRNRQRTSGIGVTTQHDQRTVYRKRSMPRYRKRRWRSFVKRVHAVSAKDMGSRTVIFNKSVFYNNSTTGNQIVGGVYLYPQQSAITTHANDLQNISTLENFGNPTAAAGTTMDLSTKVLFQSAILDVTFKNNSTYNNAGTLIPASEAKLEVDVYECTIRTGVEETGVSFGNIESLLNDNSTKTSTIGGGGTEIVYNLRGVTPFDLTYVQSRWGLKIWKKTKYVVPNNDTFTYQVRDPSRRTATYRDLSSKDGFNRPGWTRILLFTAKLVPDLPVGNVATTYQEGLVIGATRKYLYKVEGANEDRTRYLSNT